MELYSEHIVAKKKSVKEVLISFAIFLVTAFIVGAAGVVIFMPYGGLVFVGTVGIVAGSYYLITRFNVEYEYILTNDSLDIDLIINRKKRKRIITVSVKTFDFLAPVGIDEFADKEKASVTRSINAASSADSENAYFALFSKDGQKIKLIFEPTEKMLESFKIYAPHNIYVK